MILEKTSPIEDALSYRLSHVWTFIPFYSDLFLDHLLLRNVDLAKGSAHADPRHRHFFTQKG